MENKSSVFGIIALIIGASGLGIGAYSMVNFQTVEGPQGLPGQDGEDGLDMVGLQVGILDPDEGETVSGNITIRVMVWASSDYSLSILFDGFEIGSSSTLTWNSSVVLDGWHNLTVIATDILNNVVKDEIWILVNNNPLPTPQGGSVFIRWGNRTAPEGTTLLYWGLGCAGVYTGLPGAPSDPIVLTYDPPPEPGGDDIITNPAFYPLRLHGNLPTELFFYMDYLVFAAVCYALEPTFILWGSWTPPTGCRVLYKGYAMGSASSSNNYEINPICVDSDDFDNFYLWSGAQAAADLYGLEIAGGPHTPPYIPGGTLKCAVVALDS
ncbi:MAG: hypothetical protein ACFFBC_00135 [Promethearchaeota archaeon]